MCWLRHTEKKVRPRKDWGVRAETLTGVDNNAERWWEAELYRLTGELTLQATVHSPQSQSRAAEVCFHKAIATARQQRAKSLELRATVSLARLWQQQALDLRAKRQKQKARSPEQQAPVTLEDTHRVLSDIHHWFTEGFDTKDLQEAKALLDELTSPALLVRRQAAP